MLALLTLACPPLAVWSAEKRSRPTVVNLLLTLFLYVPGVIHAWRIVDRHLIAQRYDRLWRYLEQHA
ncbi:MAG: YqaE/Pmp3 family membrane protein [Gemmataceae bacterium]|nr:YqaE/Pmp3 family membrane protein [Gemmataceae bacterium]MCS7269687.1 YqaE/Pmp3 family membrane protein [Gemmataceae bacterium]MDW8242275.1 YqaE/Pmp3 family membrane protein [Thermogemmata sp.]